MNIKQSCVFFSFLFVSLVFIASSVYSADKPSLKKTGDKTVQTPEGYEVVLTVSSPDGQRVAYIASKGSKKFIITGNKISNAYDWIRPPFFTPDGRHAAYLAGRKGKSFIGIDDKEIEAYGYACRPVFSPDSARFAYEVKGGDKEVGEKREFVVVDNKKGPAYDEVRRFAFSPDSKYFVYGARKGDKWFIVIDDKEGTAYSSASDIIFSPDSRHIAYVAQKGAEYFLAITGREMNRQKEIELPDKPHQPVFSADGSSLMYGVRQENEIIRKVEQLE